MTRKAPRLGAVLAALSLLSAGRGLAAELASGSVTVPFEISAGHIVAPITVKGRRQQAMLDTGAPRTLIDQTYAESLGMGPSLMSRWLGYGRGTVNGVEVQSIHTADIAVGGWSRAASVGVTDLGVLASRNLPPVILGADLFEQWVVELDFDAQRMTLHP
ncbi:MAG: hypothetical protein JWM33_374, partial [Caulobacteraceae bacterium]|nr:hypothetical protein [Caulobacteraceae bacterium]